MREKSRAVKLSKHGATPIVFDFLVDVLIGRGLSDRRETAAAARLVYLQVLNDLNIRGARRPINRINVDYGDTDWFGCRSHVCHQHLFSVGKKQGVFRHRAWLAPKRL